MPPSLDVYVISPERNRETIERFLATYVDGAASEDRGNEELMLVAMDVSGQPSTGDKWDWEPAKTLTHIVERGLEFPRRAFSAYLKPLDSSLDGAMLAFDVDNQVIFGLSIDDEGAKSENLQRAKNLLHEMAQRLGATHGFVAVEEPPPLRGSGTPPRDSGVFLVKYLINRDKRTFPPPPRPIVRLAELPGLTRINLRRMHSNKNFLMRNRRSLLVLPHI